MEDAERYLAKCAAASERAAAVAVEELVQDLKARQCQLETSALLTGAGRPLPALSGILASHALIHTAEGEFFRNALRIACERLGIQVASIRERDLEGRVNLEIGGAASRVQQEIASFGRSIGPPWTKDHKTAALAAWALLVHGSTGR